MVPKLLRLLGILRGKSGQMKDSTEPPAAQRWRALAKDSYAVAEGTTDEETKLIMRKIGQGYEHMAAHAEAREASPIVVRSTLPERGSA